MREIKFRAWDKAFGKMFEVAELTVREDGLWARTPFGYLPNQRETTGFKVGVSCELMQYTGLKDKNGKEIYEGDIFPHRGMNLVVRYELGAVVGHWFGSNEYIFFDHLANDENDIEVIGNVWENPELIKEVK